MNRRILCHLLALFIGCAAMNLDAQGTAFSYQGQLNEGGSPANGSYDLQFSLYDAPTNGNLISGPLTNLAVSVNNGLFTTNIDFGPVFNGTNYWLAIGVRTNGSTNVFTFLQPLQPVLPVPYAIFANSASFAFSASNVSGTVSATQLTGTLPSAQLSGTYSGAVSFANVGNSFSGNGSGLFNLNGTQVTSGTVADARLSTNVAFLNGNQTFTGTNLFTNANSFTNRGNSFIGSFFGNGLVGWIPVSVTSTQAMPDAGYLLLSSNLTTVTLPPTNELLVGDIVRISGAGTGGWVVAQNTNEFIYGPVLSTSNSFWLQASAAGAGITSIASSVSGLKMVASSGGGGGIYTSTDAGQTWNSTGSSFSPIAVASSASGAQLVGVINGGGIVISTNFGSTWTLVLSGNNNWQSVASSYDGTKLVAVMNGGVGEIAYSLNSGANWVTNNSTSGAPAGDWFSVASSASGSTMAAVNTGGFIYTSTSFGVSWTPQTGAPKTNWTAIASSSDGVKLAATVAGGGIYTSGNGGTTWTQQTNAPIALWSAISSSADGAQLAAAVKGGGIYISSNFGVTWNLQQVASQDWDAIASSADGTKIAAGYATTTSTGGIYYWQAVPQSASTTTGATGSLNGGQGSAVELQYIGGGQFMPVSSAGSLWAN
ncbi:MAG: hypothetical protein ABSF34_06155 [Verrucomicrobiota bacterium]